MAYLSDTDLATLHKKRLEEKNNYKLSWYNSSNSRFYNDDDHRQQCSSTSTMKREEHKVKSKVFSASHSVVKTRPSILQFNKAKSATRTVFDRDNNSAFDDAVATRDTKCCYSTKSLDVNGNSSDFFDDGYFSSPTMSRRRSGTWP